MNTHPNYEEVLRRHALPEVLFHPDIAFALGLSVEVAEEGARSGRFGPEFYVDGRVAVLRQDFLDVLAHLGESKRAGGKEVLGQRLHVLRGADETVAEREAP